MPALTQCAKDCGPHNRAYKYGCARLCGSQFLAHAVAVRQRAKCRRACLTTLAGMYTQSALDSQSQILSLIGSFPHKDIPFLSDRLIQYEYLKFLVNSLLIFVLVFNLSITAYIFYFKILCKLQFCCWLFFCFSL